MALFKGHTNTVTSVAVTRDCDRVISASRDGSVTVWKVNVSRGNTGTGTGACAGKPRTDKNDILLTLKGHVGLIWFVRVSDDDQRVEYLQDQCVLSWDMNASIKTAAEKPKFSKEYRQLAVLQNKPGDRQSGWGSVD